MLCQIGFYFWNDVIFGDENRLKLLSRRRREYVRRPQGSRCNPKYTTKTVKFGGKSIMVWGAIKQMAPEFSYGVRIAWILLDMRRFWRKDCYQSMRHIIPFNRTVHHVKIPKLSLLFCVLSDWSAQSLDLNIIEPLWSELKVRISSRKPDNIETLWRACEEQWAKIPVPNKKSLWKHS